MDEKLTPDRAMVKALEGISGLSDKVWPLQPKKNAVPPFVFYIQTDDAEDEALDQMSGLQHTGYALHAVAFNYQGLSVIGGCIKTAMKGLEGFFWPQTTVNVSGTAEEDVGRVLIENVQIRQVSPDIFETEVGYYRRVYQVDFDYQTERSDSA